MRPQKGCIRFLLFKRFGSAYRSAIENWFLYPQSKTKFGMCVHILIGGARDLRIGNQIPLQRPVGALVFADSPPSELVLYAPRALIYSLIILSASRKPLK